MEQSLCDVCEAEPVSGCAASSIGPFSIAYGLTCVGQNAEPLWALHAFFGTEQDDDLKRMIRAQGLSPGAMPVFTYIDGAYVDVVEWSRT